MGFGNMIDAFDPAQPSTKIQIHTAMIFKLLLVEKYTTKSDLTIANDYMDFWETNRKLQSKTRSLAKTRV